MIVVSGYVPGESLGSCPWWASSEPMRLPCNCGHYTHVGAHVQPTPQEVTSFAVGASRLKLNFLAAMVFTTAQTLSKLAKNRARSIPAVCLTPQGLHSTIPALHSEACLCWLHAASHTSCRQMTKTSAEKTSQKQCAGDNSCFATLGLRYEFFSCFSMTKQRHYFVLITCNFVSPPG